MSLDPYSHTRLFELRQEQLARKAKRREQLGLHDGSAHSSFRSFSTGAEALLARLRSSRKHATPAKPAGRPALDS